MADLLQLSIVTPERQIVADEVEQVNVPGIEGDLGVLYDHAPILTLLRAGTLSYEKNSGEEVVELVVSGGYFEVTSNRVIVLAETAEFLDEIDHQRAEEAKAKAEKMLGQSDLDDDAFEKAQKKLFRALARLETVQQQKK